MLTLCFSDDNPDLKTLQLIFIVNNDLSDNQILLKIKTGDFYLERYVFERNIKDKIMFYTADIPKDRIWILKEKGFNAIVSIMLNYI